MESLLSLANWLGLAAVLEAEGWNTSRLGTLEGSRQSIDRMVEGLAVQGVFLDRDDAAERVGEANSLAKAGWRAEASIRTRAWR